MTQRGKQRLWVITVFLVVLIADQGSKAIIDHVVDRGRHAGTETTFFYFTHERNPGLVGGTFSDSRVIVLVAPVVATLVLLYLYKHLAPDSMLQTAAFGMVAGGAVGNLIDRFVRGTVVDFLQFNFYFLPDWLGLPTKRYPAFNLADTAICIGVAILIFTWHRMGKREETNHAPDTA